MTENDVRNKIKKLSISNDYLISFTDKIGEYIVKTREIRPYSDLIGFYLDDDDAFVECIKDMDSDKIFNRIVSIFQYINKKFGWNVDTDARLCFYDSFDWDIDPVSIKELYFKNIAACTERAAFTHNVLKILGYDAIFVVGSISKGEVKEGHCYNLVNLKSGAHILIDTSNGVFINGEKETNTSYIFPLISKLSASKYTSLMEGRGCSIDNEEIIIVKDFTLQNDEKRFYK